MSPEYRRIPEDRHLEGHGPFRLLPGRWTMREMRHRRRPAPRTPFDLYRTE